MSAADSQSLLTYTQNSPLPSHAQQVAQHYCVHKESSKARNDQHVRLRTHVSPSGEVWFRAVLAVICPSAFGISLYTGLCAELIRPMCSGSCAHWCELSKDIMDTHNA